MQAFITSAAAFLPGQPVPNNAIEQYLGPVSGLSSKTRRLILRGNGIEQRYYAIDPETGRQTHTNAELAATAVRALFTDQSGRNLDELQCLCCGTSSPDQLMPGHASMVHGALNSPSCEVVSTAGICLTGISALKYGAMSVALGLTENAAVCGSELASTFLGTDFFHSMGHRASPQAVDGNKHGLFAFEEQFLRWMLSDGAGAVLVEREPAKNGPSLQIEWIEILSLANELEACMVAGAVKQEDGSLRGWREFARDPARDLQGVMTIKQDTRLLNREITRTLVGTCLPRVAQKHGLTAGDVDWFLPHYSSKYFRAPLAGQLDTIDFHIDEQRWFTNLATRGNTGSASFFIMLEELFSSGRLNKGDRILGFIPESGRFSVGYVLLRVIG